MGENGVLFWDKNREMLGKNMDKMVKTLGMLGKIGGQLSFCETQLQSWIFADIWSWFVKKNNNKQELHVFEQTNGMCSLFHYNVDLQMIATQKRTTMFGENLSYPGYQPANPSRQAALPNREWGHLQFPWIFVEKLWKIGVQEYWVHGNKPFILPPCLVILGIFSHQTSKPRAFPWLVRSRPTTPSKALFTSYESVFLKRSVIIWLLISWENYGKLHVGSPKHFRNSMLRNLWFNRLVEKG